VAFRDAAAQMAVAICKTLTLINKESPPSHFWLPPARGRGESDAYRF
jgi:hypothetical protein